MRKLIVSLIVNSIALYAAIALLDGRGINPQSTNWLSFVWLALIFGLVNALLRPVLSVVGCPVFLLSQGLGTLLVNTVLFYLAGWIGTSFQVGFTVRDVWAALLGALILTLVSMAMFYLLGRKRS